MEITTTTIGKNRYAPEGADDINLYGMGASGQLTIGQLALAVSIRTAAAMEAQSVTTMNRTSANAAVLEDASNWMRQIADGSARDRWSEAKAFAMNTLGIPATSLPDNINSYDKRMQAVTAFKGQVDPLVQKQQQAMIDLQTYVNRRDVAYNTGSNIVRTLANSMAGEAYNFR